MKPSQEHNDRIAKMKFSSVYPHYVAKVIKKGRTEQELKDVIQWLTGFNADQLADQIRSESTFEAFFSGRHNSTKMPN